MPLSPGTRFGPYEIRAPLGAGGMGEVYSALDTRLNRTVAIKVVRSDDSATPEQRQRFTREALAASSLNDPHICTIYDVGHESGTDFIVMEHLDGETLADRLKRGALPLESALRVGIEIAGALDKAHRRGIVHRDLKPSNVMLTKSGAKLLDFGLASMARSGHADSPQDGTPSVTASLTTVGEIVGTLHYMAPEQLEGKAADARSDLFALGAMLYEMVTGTKPFGGSSQAAVVASILKSEPQPASRLSPSAPPSVDRLIQACLAKDPDVRWQSAYDLMVELRWLQQTPDSLSTVRGSEGTRRRERAVWAGAVVGLSLALAGVLLLPRWQSDQGAQGLLSVMPPTANSLISEAILSPDGRRLAFTASNAEGKNLLWIRDLESAQAEPLRGTEDSYCPFWSPDGRMVGFFAGGKLLKIEVPGGRPEIVCDAPLGLGGTWNQKGTILFGTFSSGVMRVSSAGGKPTAVTFAAGATSGIGDVFPCFLPDGRRFVFLRTSPVDSLLGIYIGSTDAPEAKRLLPDYSRALYVSPDFLFFVRSGNLMAQKFEQNRLSLRGEPTLLARSVAQTDFANFIFSATDNGLLAYRVANPNSHLTWFDRQGHEIGRLGEPADYVHVDISPDGRRVAVERIERPSGTHDIWVFDGTRSTPSRLTFSGNAIYPIWSPDGSRIAFSFYQDGNYHLYEKRASGEGAETQLLASKLDKWPTSWSPDGRYLVFEGGFVEGPPDIWLLSLGSRKAIPFEKTLRWENCASVSPDGRWLAYTGNESGKSGVYVQSFPDPGSKWQISTEGGGEYAWPRWRGDGKELFCAAQTGQIVAVSVNSGAAFQAGAPRVLFQLSGAKVYKNRYPYAVSRDGQRFLAILQDRQASAVTIALDWRKALKRQ